MQSYHDSIDSDVVTAYTHSMYTLRTVSEFHYWQFITELPDISFQQTPEWNRARNGTWRPELVGWYDQAENLVSACAIRYGKLPGINRHFAFIPHGPLVDWQSPDLRGQLQALVEYLAQQNVFGIRIAPFVSLNRWNAATVKAALADTAATSFSDIEPDFTNPRGDHLVTSLRRSGWHESPQDKATEESQPRFNFWLDLDGKTEDDILAGMHKTWRYNARKAIRDGVEVGLATMNDLTDFHCLYQETAERNGFDSQPISFFATIWNTMGDDFPGHFSTHLARYDGEIIAASTTAQVNSYAQCIFTATSMSKPKVKPSNAVYMAIIREAIARGATTYDLGGVKDTVDKSHPAAGLIRFKTEMGADAHEYVGSWDLAIEPRLYSAFTKLLPAYSRASSWLRGTVAGTGSVRDRRMKSHP